MLRKNYDEFEVRFTSINSKGACEFINNLLRIGYVIKNVDFRIGVYVVKFRKESK